MFIDDKLIGSIQLEQNRAAEPEYMYQKKRELEDKYKEVVDASGTVPTYLIEARTTTENRKRK